MNLMKSYQRFAVRAPIISQSITVACLTTCGDIISQNLFAGKENVPYDYVRTARFAFYGFFIVGPSVRVWYGVLERLFPGQTGRKALQKMSIDQILFAPAFQGMALAILELFKFKPIAEIKNTIKCNYRDVMITNYKVWPAAQLVNFFLIPFQFRVLFSSVIALFWNVYFTWKVGNS